MHPSEGVEQMRSLNITPNIADLLNINNNNNNNTNANTNNPAARLNKPAYVFPPPSEFDHR